MNTKIINCLLLSAFLLSVSPAEAQQPGKIHRIGVLLPWSAASGVSLSFLKGFRQGLHELV